MRNDSTENMTRSTRNVKTSGNLLVLFLLYKLDININKTKTANKTKKIIVQYNFFLLFAVSFKIFKFNVSGLKIIPIKTI